MKLIMYGPPASGKGTQAKKIAAHLKIPAISTGEIFRKNISEETELGKIAAAIINDGNLVPDDITNNMVKNRLQEEDCKEGFVLDGYPRTVNQADFLAELPYKINGVISLEVSEESIITRVSSRRVCMNCKADFNTIYIKPKVEGICDKCEGKLITREDDKPEAVKVRLEAYTNQTAPLLDYYKTKGLLLSINGEQAIEKVFEDIVEILKSIQE
jgi:adenylate kinase